MVSARAPFPPEKQFLIKKVSTMKDNAPVAIGSDHQIFVDDFWIAEAKGGVRWGRGENLGALAGRPVRLRFALKDADLYAFRFQTATGAPD